MNRLTRRQIARVRALIGAQGDQPIRVPVSILVKLIDYGGQPRLAGTMADLAGDRFRYVDAYVLEFMLLLNEPRHRA